jgi:hypothetical protein
MDVKVPDGAGNAWTAALDYVTVGKLYRIEVPSTSKWKPESANECNADGDALLTRNGEPIITTAAVGALIAKIGGSTADLKPDKDKLILFGVGRHCVFSVSDSTKVGSLYLGINDIPNSRSQMSGELTVTIYESL